MNRDFSQIYHEHVFQVYGYVAYRLESRADAEDLTQQTFEQALRAWSRFDPNRSSVGTWLIAIARNLLIDRYRRDTMRTHEPIREDRIHESELPYAEIGIDLGLEPELAEALSQLSQRSREVIALRFGAELTGPEIADLLNLSVANVQQIISRSLRKLRSLLERAQTANGPSPASPTAPTARSNRPDPT